MNHNNSTDNIKKFGKNHLKSDMLSISNESNSTADLPYSYNPLIFHNTEENIEDEIGSIDCIYAYRGAGALSDELALNRRSNDDETDYLEMDFDPDPPSEIELNSNTNTILDQSSNLELFRQEMFVKEKFSESREKFPSNQKCVTLEEKKDSKDSTEHFIEKTTTSFQDKNLSNEISNEKGAKPKIKLDNGSHNSKRKLDNIGLNKKILPHIEQHESYAYSAIKDIHSNQYLLPKKDNCSRSSEDIKNKQIIEPWDQINNICINYLEKESVTSCSNCSLTQKTQECVDNSINLNIDLKNLNLTNVEDINILKPSQESSTNALLVACDLALNNCDINKDNTFLESIKISSVNCKSDTLVDALSKLNVKYDETIINKYFNEDKNHFVSVCDFLLYSSKKNCNYKKLINLLNLACGNQITAEFEIDQTKSNEFIEVEVNTLLQYWQINNDLKGIKNLDYRFKEMNVLGKLVSKIRQMHQRLPKKALTEVIEIPQYYKSGYIKICKINKIK